MDEPPRYGNADEAALEPTERRDLILATLAIQRAFWQMWGRDATVQDVERALGLSKDERPDR